MIFSATYHTLANATSTEATIEATSELRRLAGEQEINDLLKEVDDIDIVDMERLLAGWV